MKIYISGKITGDDDYREKFCEAENRLRELGYEVFNPAIFPNIFTWDEFMDIDLKILSHCDAIYLLDDWRESKGAVIEISEAEKLGIPVVHEEDAIFGNTLLKLCNDTEMLIDEDLDESCYPERMRKICSLIRLCVKNFDFLKSDEDNFRSLLNKIPESEKDFFFDEFIKDSYIQIEYDIDEEKTDWKIRKYYSRMIGACRKMSELSSEELFIQEQVLA